MARRLYKTTADYLTIAIAPALIMALVASLVFFLLTVFYRGPHLHRLQYVMFLFVFAAVLIARIAMEEGRERAILYSVLLGIAVIFVVSQLSDLPLLLSIGLIALIWWSADRLTWDSTLIDERERDTGEGLLQTVGLNDRGPAPRNGKPDADADVEPLGVTSREEGASEQRTWWRRAWEYYHKPHAPGVWVVYFSLAALPIFGLGQRFVPGSSDSDIRRAAFRYLFIYVASALALLLSTCFLGLRRYLRQRRVEMPDNLAVTWIATGAAMILALLLFCTLLPRPGAEYAVSRVPLPFGSPGNRASWLSFGEDGVKDAEKPGRGRDQSPHGEGQSKDGDPSQPGGHAEGEGSHGEPGQRGEPTSGQGDPKQSDGDGGSGSDASSGGRGANGKQQSSSSGNGRQKSGKKGDSSSNGKSQSKSDSQTQGGSDGEQSSGSTGKKQPSGGESSGQSGDSRPNSASNDAVEQGSQSSQQAASREQPQASGEQSQASQPPPPPPSNRPRLNPMSWLGSLFGFLGTMLKLIFYAALILVGFWLYRKYKDELLAGFRDLFKDLRAFWDRLFGRQGPAAAEAEAAPVAAGPTYRPFASYPDPFASGKAGRYTPEQLVKYSFEAFEAWAREHGCPRHPEQTPHEFAQAIGAKNASVSRPARALAELYSRLAYAPGPLPPSSLDHLKQLWTALRS